MTARWSPRWEYQYWRVADVLRQRVEQLKPSPHCGHEQYVKKDGSCYICRLVDSAPPLTSEQKWKLSQLLGPVLPRPSADAAINDPVQLAKAGRIVRTALNRKATSR